MSEIVRDISNQDISALLQFHTRTNDLPLRFKDYRRPKQFLQANRIETIVSDRESLSRQDHSIDIRHHFIRQKIADNSVALEYISTRLMVVDVLTEPLYFPCTHCRGQIL